MYSWQKINLEQDPWWLEYRLNIDNMQGRVWRSSSGLLPVMRWIGMRMLAHVGGGV